MVKPVQDEVYDAIEKVAKQKQLQIIFDKSSGLVMLYTNPVHDYTEFVMEALGLASPNKNTPAQAPTVNAEDTPASTIATGEAEPDVPAADTKNSVKKVPTKTQPKKK